MAGLLTSLWQAVLCLVLLLVGTIALFAIVYFVVACWKTIWEEVKRR